MIKNWKILIGCMLIIWGCVFTYVNTKIGQEQLIKFSQFQNTKALTKTEITRNEKRNGNFNGLITKEADNDTTLNNAFNKDIPVLGMMSIPEINMKNPIINGYGNNGDYLAVGACTMKPNESMGQGNYALAGHYMDSDTVFHSLHNVKYGMKVYISDMHNIYVYQVENISTINKYDVSVIHNIPNKKIITLITCADTQETPYRTLVQGHLISKLPATHSNLIKTCLLHK